MSEGVPPDWVKYIGSTIVGAIGTILSFVLGRQGYRWLVTRKRDNAETIEITAASERTTIQASSELARQFLAVTSEGAKELRAAHRRLIASEACLWKCVRLMQSCGIDTGQIEAEIRAIHNS
jgi:hypothetical protein